MTPAEFLAAHPDFLVNLEADDKDAEATTAEARAYFLEEAEIDGRDIGLAIPPKQSVADWLADGLQFVGWHYCESCDTWRPRVRFAGAICRRCEREREYEAAADNRSRAWREAHL